MKLDTVRGYTLHVDQAQKKIRDLLPCLKQSYFLRRELYCKNMKVFRRFAEETYALLPSKSPF